MREQACRDRSRDRALAARVGGRSTGIAKVSGNAGLGAAGIVLAPPTFGWSQLVTAGSGFMLVWDGIDISVDYFKNLPNHRRLRKLRSEAFELADELAAIIAA